MGLFKRYKSINDIIKIKDEEELINELYKYLDKKCLYGESIDKLSEKEKDLYLILSFTNEMSEGGFEQYFSNIYASYIDDIILAFNHINESSISQVINDTSLLFPNKDVLKDDNDKRNILELLLLDNPSLFELPDEKYYELNIDLQPQIMNLIHSM